MPKDSIWSNLPSLFLLMSFFSFFHWLLLAFRRFFTRLNFRGIFFFIFFVLLFFFWYFVFGPSTQRDGSFYNRSMNGVWLEHEWIDREKTAADFDRLLRDFHRAGIRFVYVHVGPLERNGEIPNFRYPAADFFVSQMRARDPDIMLYAWIGQIRSKIPYERTEVRRATAKTAAHFVHDLGFDGVHYDIEPLHDTDDAFLSLLDETRAALTIGVTDPERVKKIKISVATSEILPRLEGKIASYFLHLDDFNRPDFYQEIAKRVDQIVIMAYENSIPRGSTYEYFLKNEVIWATDILEHVEILVGIPTYDQASSTFFPQAENVRTGLRGITAGLNNWRSDDEKLTGVALYRYGTTSESEWQDYAKLWGRDTRTE